MRDRARWAEAARNDLDRLGLDEFLAFTHPESSHRALLQMVEDLFEKFGKFFLMCNKLSITAPSILIIITIFMQKYNLYINIIYIPKSVILT